MWVGYEVVSSSYAYSYSSSAGGGYLRPEP